VLNGDSGTATAGLVETSQTLTLDQLSPASIAEIIEAIEAPDVDGYAVYVPASDSAPVSEAMPLAA